jgi:Cytochrome P460
MKSASLLLLGAALLFVGGLAMRPLISSAEPRAVAVSPIYGVTIPQGYRSWVLIAPALEDAPLNELRAVLGNRIAVDAFLRGTRPFPDGAILVKLAWKRRPSPEFAPATIPGDATTVQVMVKDANRYSDSGGWGFGRFIQGRPVDEAQHRTCFACHDARVRERDWVFTRYAH